MQEMILVGRGGEGVVVASQILADAFARAGHWVQSFPEFKAERRGAPIAAFLRWDDAPIRRRYRVHDCDVLVGISPVPPSPDLLRTVRPGGLVLLNREARLPIRSAFSLARVPASRIARDHHVLSPEGRPMANVAVLGACVRLLLTDGLPFLQQAIEARMGRGAAANLLAAREGYARCRTQRSRPGDVLLEPAAGMHAPGHVPLFPVSNVDSRGNLTGSWSLERPVLGDACSACGLCALFCPEGVITRVDGVMAIDERYCKGCGICAEVCPVHGALAMVEVRA